MRTKLLLLLAMAFTFAMVGTALAQDNATEDAYGGVLGEEVTNQGSDSETPPVQQPVEENDSTPPVVAQETGDSLPFTGLELGLIALAGIGLVALGVAMRRSTRGSPGSA